MPPSKPPPAPTHPIHVEQARLIGEHGWMTTGVMPTVDQPIDPFTYTVGLWRSYDHAELVIVGMDPNDAYDIFARAVERIQGGERFEGGTEDDAIIKSVATEEGVPVAFRQVASGIRDENLLGARRWNAREDFPALQIVWPDPRFLFPWDEGYDRTFIQPLWSIEGEQ